MRDKWHKKLQMSHTVTCNRQNRYKTIVAKSRTPSIFTSYSVSCNLSCNHFGHRKAIVNELVLARVKKMCMSKKKLTAFIFKLAA